MNTYSFEVSSTDVGCALDCEADRAEEQGMKAIVERQRATSLHLRNAVFHMEKLTPPGYRTKVEIVVSHVPAVNSVLKDEYRR